MKRFKDMKIAKKLVIGFIVVALIAGIVGCFGIYFTKTINYAGTRLYKENTLGIKYVADADILYQRIRYNGLKMMLDKSQAGTLQKKIDTFKDQLEECWQEYEKTVSSNEERELYDELAKDWISYSKYTDTVTEYILKDKVDKAKELIFGDMATTGSNLQTVVDKLFELNSKQARVRSEQNDALEQSALYIMVIIIVAGMLFAVLLGIIISRIISVPVNKMKDTANQLALGDVNVNIDINSKDEIGDLAESMKLMISNIREQAKAAERLAEGDLSIDVAVRSDQDLLGRKLYELVEKNNEVIYNIAAASDQVAAGSKQISDSGVALSQGATEQASTIEQLTASLEEISSQTKLNAENAGQANELAETAKVTAVQGNTQMKEMQNAMDEINTSSANIYKIIKVIDEIAFQTNILALNAAVEAARAGQHGKGFAVVAEEVRNLAARSANAAKETTDLIEGSVHKVEAGTKIANETAVALNQIVENVTKVARLVADIATASNEQALGIEQINQGVMQVSQVVQTNSATAEESAAASEELSSQAEALREEVAKYKLKKEQSVPRKYDKQNSRILESKEGMEDSGKADHMTENRSREKGFAKHKIVLRDDEFGKY